MNKLQKYDFNNLAQEYDDFHHLHSNFINIIRNQIAFSAEKVVLDIGCGTGNETVSLHKSLSCQVIGVEPADEMLQVAKQKSNSIKWEVGTAENIPACNSSIDLITSFFSIHHFGNIDKAIKEFKRVLKENGKVIFFTISHEQMRASLEYKYLPDLLKDDLARVPEITDIERVLKNNGFSIKKGITEYEERPIDKTYLEMVKNQYRSGLKQLPDEQIKRAVSKISEDILNGQKLIDKIMCTVIIAEKRVHNNLN